MPTLSNLKAAAYFLPLLVATTSCSGEEVFCNGQEGKSFTLPASQDGPGLELAVDGSRLSFVLTNSLGLTVLSGTLGTKIPVIAGPPVAQPDCDAELCLR